VQDWTAEFCFSDVDNKFWLLGSQLNDYLVMADKNSLFYSVACIFWLN
jgi:hypothetical protein